MYFRPGIKIEVKSEFWLIWQESPLFGQSEILINQGNIYNLINNIC